MEHDDFMLILPTGEETPQKVWMMVILFAASSRWYPLGVLRFPGKKRGKTGKTKRTKTKMGFLYTLCMFTGLPKPLNLNAPRTVRPRQESGLENWTFY